MDTKLIERLKRVGINTDDQTTISSQIKQKIEEKEIKLAKNFYSENPEKLKTSLKDFNIDTKKEISAMSKSELVECKEGVDAAISDVINRCTTDLLSVEVLSLKGNTVKDRSEEVKFSHKEFKKAAKEVVDEYKGKLIENSLFPKEMRGDDMASKLCRIKASENWLRHCNKFDITSPLNKAQQNIQANFIKEAVDLGEKFKKLEEISDFIKIEGSIKNLKDLETKTKSHVEKLKDTEEPIVNVDNTKQRPRGKHSREILSHLRGKPVMVH